MTTVYFVQHGIAESKDIDPSRPLSKVGIEETTRLANHLKQSSVSIDKIFHSGKLRAKQTAAIFSDVLNVAQVTELNGMAPNDDPALLIGKLTDDHVMYVGHLPHMQKVVSKIISGDESNAVIAFKNSSVACVEIKDGKGQLNWFVTPSLCR